MNKINRVKKTNAGMAMVTALIFVSIMVLVITSLTAQHVMQRLQVDHFEDNYICFAVAEAAVAQGKMALDRYDWTFRVGIPTSWEPEFNETTNAVIMPSLDDAGITPATLATVPGAEYIIYVHEWESDGRDTNLDGTPDSIAEIGFYSVHVVARHNAYTRQFEAVYSSHDIGVWRNAIFAGAGAAGRAINGNVTIAGSVHILGEGLNPGDTVATFNGTGHIQNHYNIIGMPNQMFNRIPALKQVMVDGVMKGTLDTNLRVRNGVVSLSGNSRVGDPADASLVKMPVDGTYNTGGWAGDSLDADGNPTQVFSDNGFSEPYDCGDLLSFPLLSDPWRNPDGTFVDNPNTGTLYTHEEYFSEVLVGGDDGFFEGNLSITASDNAGQYFNATTGDYITGPAVAAVVPDPDDSYLLIKPKSNVLEINGNIRINGNLTFTGSGGINQASRTLLYNGSGALLVTGSVLLDANLITQAIGPNAFPNNCLGVMAKGPVSLSGGAGLQVMGAWYSEHSIVSSFQSNNMGTFVAPYFNMGNQVPRILQVPVLADNLPFGMIGDYPIINMRDESWREITIEQTV